RRHAADAELQEAAADVGGRLDVALTVLVGVTDVDDGDRLPGGQPPLQVRGSLLRHDGASLCEHFLERLHPIRPFLIDMGAPTWPPNPPTLGTPRRSRGAPRSSAERGAPTWPPNSRRSGRPGAAVAPLDPPRRGGPDMAPKLPTLGTPRRSRGA